MTLEATNPQSKNSFMERIRLEGQGTANPATIVTASDGKARFTVLTPRLLRLEWSHTGEFEERGTFAFPNRYTPNVANFTVQTDSEGVLTIDTGYLKVQYRPGSGPFSPQNLQIKYEVAGQNHSWTPGTPNPLNLGGTNRTLDNTSGDVRISEGLVSRAGWSLFDDSKSVLLNPSNSWVEPRRNPDDQDWYFFGYGHDYKAALHEYIEFGGAIPLVPRFVLGAWWSRYWAYSDKDLEQLVLDFEQRNLSLDVLVIDMDWHTTDSWTGYTWNKELFPDPAGFLKWVHQHGLRTTLNLHPALGVQSFEEAYPAFATDMGLDPAQGETIPFHITNQDFTRNYFELLHHPLEEQGVDFWWMDWQQGESSEMAGLDPLIWLNHLHFYDSARRNLRPMLYSRWGGLGNHRYHIGFSGDTYATWGALQFQPYMTATASNVLYGWWSHDIGGHIGPTDPELYARWVQYGALSPCLRLHSTKDPLAERRPWAFAPDVYEATKAAFNLRYQLVPYLYTWGRVASDTAVGLCRPMYYEYPESEAAYNARYQYMLGDDMLVAPIVFPADPINGIAAIDVWLPAGSWIDYHTLETWEGPRWVRMVGDINRVPMLVKAGAIVALASIAPTTDAQPKDHLALRIFVQPNTNGAFRLYEDDGTTAGYIQGQFQWTNITARTTDTAVEIEIGAIEGNCESLPTTRQWEIVLEGANQPTGIKTHGAQASDATHEAGLKNTIVRFTQSDKKLAVKLVVNYSQGAISTLSQAHNRELALADVRRLLGEGYNGLSFEQLLQTIPSLLPNVPGRADALARLGGPFVRVLEYVAVNDTVRQLGTVIVAQPSVDTAKALEVEVNWTLFRNGHAETFVTTASPADNKGGGFILHSPFAVGPTDQAQTLQWTAEVKLQWGDTPLIFAHRSKTLFPAIPDWQVLVYDQQAQPDFGLAQILNDVNQINPNLDWQTYREEVESAVSLDTAYNLPIYKTYLERLRAGEKLAGYAVTTINSPDEREAMLEYRSAGPLEFWLNGQPITKPTTFTGGEPIQSVVYNRFQRAQRTAIVTLKAGPNTLVVGFAPPERPHWWYFSVAVVRPDASLMNDLSYMGGPGDSDKATSQPDENTEWNPPSEPGSDDTTINIPADKTV